MADYLFLFIGGNATDENLSPEEMQKHMQKWFTWIDALRDKGIYKGGEPLEEGGLIVTSDKTVTDGPFPESKEMIGGYIMIEADSIEAASELAKDCPALSFGGRVEVRQVAVIEHANPAG